MRLYETTFITDSQLPETEIEAEIKRVEDLIKSNGGEIVETQRWGVRRLAYEIERRRQGYYAHFLYQSEHSVPALLDASFKINEKIMRHLTVVSEVDLEERARQIAEGITPVRAVLPDEPRFGGHSRRDRRHEQEDN
ncbi:MAG: 30S ribosomal protein S6 [Candidatus Zixiibacteriota bacterium]